MVRSNYTKEVCVVLHELFVSKTGPKCNFLVDFAPPVCRPCVHIRMRIVVYCLKLDVKLNLVIDTLCREDVNCLMKLKGA